MLKWNFKTWSKEINSHPSLLRPNASTSSGDGTSFVSFLKREPTFLSRLMPAQSRTSALYTHAAFELWKGRDMGSKLSRNMSLKTGALWLLLMLLQLLPCNTTEGDPSRISGMATSKGVVCNDDCGAGSCMHTCSKPQVVWFVFVSNSSIHSMSGKSSLWENYAHCSAWKCFIFLSIFVQCEEPHAWRSKIQSCHCFFKGRCMQSPMFTVTSKCQLYL